MEIMEKSRERVGEKNKHNNYYEAVLQLRNKRSRVYNDAIDIIESMVTNSKREVFISKRLNVTGGIDFYLSSKRFAAIIGRKLNAKLGAEFGVSPKLFSVDKQTSKKKYRLNVLVRLPEITRGYICRKGHDIFICDGYKEGHVFISLLSGKRARISPSDVEILASPEDYLEAIVVKRKPQLEVLHPETYQPCSVENLKRSDAEKLKVVLVDGKIYAI
ncbi:MAG: NMD3-related protein [Candidatus Woesearchaeota archaeon]